jgi:predicted alpha/beta-fold hydrolase
MAIFSPPEFPPFKPARGLRSGHLQTLFSRAVQPHLPVIFQRRRLDTPDGDFLDLDFPEIPGFLPPPDAPLVLLLHGLEGSARARYGVETYIQLARSGCRAVGMNFRSCSGEMNRTARFYHAGATADVKYIYAWLETEFPGVPKGMIGFSLGANILLKLLGEWGTAAPASLRGAAAVSPPFDLLRNSFKMMRGLNRLYSAFFLRELFGKVRLKADLLAERVDLARVYSARSIREFDDLLTAPLNGFAGADDYYYRNSSRHFLPQITMPTLLIRALDDPLFEIDDIPHDIIGRNPHLLPLLSAHGGHVAFIHGRPGAYGRWAETQAARFFSALLRPNPAP